MIRNMQTTQAADETWLVTVLVEPEQKLDCFLGIYEDQIPQPPVNFDIQPGYKVALVATLVRLDGYGEYTLMCQLVNSGMLPCEVGVHIAW